jgi:hypothetical protein
VREDNGRRRAQFLAKLESRSRRIEHGGADGMAEGEPPGRGSSSGVRRRSQRSLGEYSNAASITFNAAFSHQFRAAVSFVSALQWTGAALTVCRSSALAKARQRISGTNCVRNGWAK